MRAHIVFAHPAPNSFASAMLQVARDELEGEGYELTVSDLYVDSFDPIISHSDFGKAPDEHFLIGLEQRRAYDDGALPLAVSGEIEKVLASELLVLVFPVFWFGPPAILKGWIERVFISGPFYGGRRVYDLGGLNGRRAFVAMGVGGRQGMFSESGIHGDLVGGMMRHFFQGTLGYVGLDVYEPYVAYHVPYVTQEERANSLSELRSAIRGLESRPRLRFPRTCDFSSDFCARAAP